MVINSGGKPKITRTNRFPSFPCHGKIKPYGLYPVFLHPVLPGETLQAATVKLNVVSMPVKNPLVGCWLETWLVYVKLTDIDPDLGQMFISDSESSTSYEASADNERTFTKNGKIDWVQLCLNKFHASYFKHETEPVESSRTVETGIPKIKLNNKSWYQNFAYEDADVAVPTTDASDMYKHLQEYAILQQMSLTEMTYEKYLEQFGGSVARAAEGDPEVLRFARSWTQPTNIVEPSTGTPTSAWVWSDDVTLGKKAKRFNEPGFILCCQAVRPKMYNSTVRATATGQLWGFSDWFPIYNLEDPTAGIKTIDTDDTIFEAASRTDPGEKTMLYDHRDLLSHGEQFVNNWSDPEYAVPATSLQSFEDADNPETLRGEYALTADINSMFSVTADSFCNYDGIAMLTISGHVKDQTPL